MQLFKSTDISKDKIIPIAQKMKKEGKRLIMIHGYIDKENNPVISYQYENQNTVEAYKVKGETILPTVSGIYDLCAAWPERELEELMGIKFEGLDITGRLFMPDTMVEGQGHILVTPLSELRKKVLGAKEE